MSNQTFHPTTIGVKDEDHYHKLTESKADCEHPAIIAGRIRQQVESLANIVNTEPLQALCDKLDQSLTVHMLSLCAGRTDGRNE